MRLPLRFNASARTQARALARTPCAAGPTPPSSWQFQLYNTVLRRWPRSDYETLERGGNLFATTIQVLVSAVHKVLGPLARMAEKGGKRREGVRGAANAHPPRTAAPKFRSGCRPATRSRPTPTGLDCGAAQGVKTRTRNHMVNNAYPQRAESSGMLSQQPAPQPGGKPRAARLDGQSSHLARGARADRAGDAAPGGAGAVPRPGGQHPPPAVPLPAGPRGPAGARRVGLHVDDGEQGGRRAVQRGAPPLSAPRQAT
jgi:hypothetical protein